MLKSEVEKGSALEMDEPYKQRALVHSGKHNTIFLLYFPYFYTILFLVETFQSTLAKTVYPYRTLQSSQRLTLWTHIAAG